MSLLSTSLKPNLFTESLLFCNLSPDALNFLILSAEAFLLPPSPKNENGLKVSGPVFNGKPLFPAVATVARTPAPAALAPHGIFNPAFLALPAIA